MNPLPKPLGAGELVAWRLDHAIFRDSWDSGIGAATFGGRWNSSGVHAVYCTLDPATAIVEVAVHVGFDDLDSTPRVLTSALLTKPAEIHVVDPVVVPNPHWLHPGRPTANQQKFGDNLLTQHGMLVIPSAVSSCSWNLIFLAGTQRGAYTLRRQEVFALDPRLTPYYP